MTTNQTIIGKWSIVETQTRIDYEWTAGKTFAPGVWELNFWPNGRWNIESRAPDTPHEYLTGSWAHDPVADHILIDIDDESAVFDDFTFDPSGTGMVFDPAPDGPWLYCFEDRTCIRPTRKTIIGSQAHERHKLKPA